MARFKGGYWRIGRWGRAPIRLHWSLPLGALALGRFKIVPGFWLGFLLLIALHELGHAYFVRRYGQRVTAIEVHGLGGVCRWDGWVSPTRRAMIAWGGVLAQAIVLALTLIVGAIVGLPESEFGAQLRAAFIEGNLWLMAFNLLPIPGLDGAEAWRLFVAAKQQRARRRAPKPKPVDPERYIDQAARRELRELDELDLGGDADAVLSDVDDALRAIADKLDRESGGPKTRAGEDSGPADGEV